MVIKPKAGKPRLQVEYRSVASLIPYANNARIHTKLQLKKLKRSIQKFGWTNPLLVDRAGNVLCGHGRLEAAIALGMEEVPTICIDHLSDAEKRGYVLADNALAEKSGWSKELLASELQGLIDLGFDVELTGFDTLDIDGFLAFGETSEPPQDDVDMSRLSADPVARLNDVFTIGRHRLVCGDARSAASYDALLAGEFAQMVFTDPPYNVPIRGNVSGLGRAEHREFLVGSGELSDNEFSLQLLRPALRLCKLYSAPGAIGFVCIDWRGVGQLADATDGVFEELKNMIVWAKTNAGMGTFYRSQHELIFAYLMSKGSHINNFGLGGGGRHRSNLWTYAGANTFRRGRMDDLNSHPTVKPKKLVADAILDCSKRDGIILDCFAGSGTTLVSAEMTGRRGYGIELDPIYCDLILHRVQDATGKKARLDGVPFDEVADQRKEGR
jgi:DNA modification methylase